MQPQDLNKAIEYAREMQRMAGNSIQPSQSISDIDNVIRPDTKNNFFKTGQNQHNGNFIRNKHTLPKGNTSEQKSNNDFSLILALILLLSSDGGDKALLLALLYILT